MQKILSIIRALQARGRFKFSHQPPEEFAINADFLKKEILAHSCATHDHYIVDPALADAIAEQEAVKNALLPQPAQEDLLDVLARIETITTVELKNGQNNLAFVFVPTTTHSSISGIRNRPRIYFLSAAPKNINAINFPIDALPAVGIINSAPRDIYDWLGFASLGFEMTPETRQDISYTTHIALACLLAVQAKTMAIQQQISSPPQTGAKKRGASPRNFTILRIDPTIPAVVKTEVTGQGDTSGERHPQYPHPFMVQSYERPSSGVIIPAHAKGGTETERNMLNAVLAAGDEEALKRLLVLYDSPQAQNPPKILRLTKVRGPQNG